MKKLLYQAISYNGTFDNLCWRTPKHKKILSLQPSKDLDSFYRSTFTGDSKFCKFSLFLTITSTFFIRSMHGGSHLKAMVVQNPKFP